MYNQVVIVSTINFRDKNLSKQNPKPMMLLENTIMKIQIKELMRGLWATGARKNGLFKRDKYSGSLRWKMEGSSCSCFNYATLAQILIVI